MAADITANLPAPFVPGTVLNPLPKVVAPQTFPTRCVRLSFPLRINAMALDPSLIVPSPEHRYTAGEVVVSIATHRSVTLEPHGTPGTLEVRAGSDRPQVIRHAVGIMRAALGVDDGIAVSAPPLSFQRHSGLGSTSSLIAAVGAAINEWYGRPIETLELIRYLAQNHGEEGPDENVLVPVQCLGGSAASGLLSGALTILAGESTPIANCELDDVEIALGTPGQFTDRDAEDLLADELRNMAGFVETGRRSAPLVAYRLMHECLPALARSDPRPLGVLVRDYRFDMGSIRNCAFALPGLDALGDRLRDLWDVSDLMFLGISSVGPTFFAIGHDLTAVQARFEAEGMTVHRTAPCNETYQVTFE